MIATSILFVIMFMWASECVPGQGVRQGRVGTLWNEGQFVSRWFVKGLGGKPRLNVDTEMHLFIHLHTHIDTYKYRHVYMYVSLDTV